MRECPTRALRKSVTYRGVKRCQTMFGRPFSYVFAFGFVGSILFFQSHDSHVKSRCSIFLAIQHADITEFGFTSRVTHGDTLSLDGEWLHSPSSVAVLFCSSVRPNGGVLSGLGEFAVPSFVYKRCSYTHIYPVGFQTYSYLLRREERLEPKKWYTTHDYSHHESG